MLQRRIPRLVLLALLWFALAGAHAVELGEARVRSHIGQPLSADIELTGMTDEKAPVQAGLADVEVYRGANIAMHPALAAASITVVQREGKRYLRISSPRRVESELVNVFFELTENGQRSVRQATLWLKADPNPAPPPAKVASAPELLAAQVAALRAAKAAPAAPPAPAPLPAPVPLAMRAPLMAPVLRAPPAAPAACVQQFTAAQIGTCTALDAKNVALKAQIADLEEKVRRLTVAMQAGSLAAPAAALAAPLALPAKLTPMGASPKPTAPTPWLFIGLASAAVFALIGVLLYVLLMRKRKGARVKPPAKAGVGFIASVKNRLMPPKKEFSLAADEEPAAG